MVRIWVVFYVEKLRQYKRERKNFKRHGTAVKIPSSQQCKSANAEKHPQKLPLILSGLLQTQRIYARRVDGLDLAFKKVVETHGGLEQVFCAWIGPFLLRRFKQGCCLKTQHGIQ